MTLPQLSEAERLERLRPPEGRVRMVLDTDTYNEVDDQFAVVHALLSPEQMRVEALYAAPFQNRRSEGPGDGMEKSYEEILRLLVRLGREEEGLVFRGSEGYLEGPGRPRESAAARDLVEKATSEEDLLYVVAIGAITNVASAILLEPEIIRRIVVVWLGGNALYWPSAVEFNLAQDQHASRLILDCGVPLVQVPVVPVASHLLTSVPELESCLGGKGAVAEFLVETVKGYHQDHFAWAKEIYDLSATAYLADPAWVPTHLVHSPILTDQVTWSHDPSRHLIRSATRLDRNAIFRDVFEKIVAGS
jgi:hypothetical protein